MMRGTWRCILFLLGVAAVPSAAGLDPGNGVDDAVVDFVVCSMFYLDEQVSEALHQSWPRQVTSAIAHELGDDGTIGKFLAATTQAGSSAWNTAMPILLEYEIMAEDMAYGSGYYAHDVKCWLARLILETNDALVWESNPQACIVRYTTSCFSSVVDCHFDGAIVVMGWTAENLFFNPANPPPPPQVRPCYPPVSEPRLPPVEPFPLP